MRNVMRTAWPIAVGILVFLMVSYFVQAHVEDLSGLLQGKSRMVSMCIFIVFGIVTVTIPFASIIPFLPVAVSLWGWPITGLLTLCAWTIGGQVLFELSRIFGKPLILKFVAEEKLESIGKLVKGKGIGRSLAARLIVHGDIVSYAFGLFTDVPRWEFFLVSLLGVAPAAFAYSYFGSLPFLYQFIIIGVGTVIFGMYWALEERKPYIQ